MSTPSFYLLPNAPDFRDLPWHLPLESWIGNCSWLEEAPRGLSRHPVVFVSYSGELYALKELPLGLAQREHDPLVQMENARLPVVAPIGYVDTQPSGNPRSVLVTRYLDRALPYRTLFLHDPSLVRGLSSYRQHLLDAIAGLLVQLHLAGFFWGDCSLSNTLFRRDAGALQAYLVDAETAEIHPMDMPALLRFHDLEIMEENINRELIDLQVSEQVNVSESGLPTSETGAYIRLRYQDLWQEITREDLIHPDEHFRVTERIRALNTLGFSVGNVELAPTEEGDQLRLRILVTDRYFHREQLLNLTGLAAEEMQARQMMNEILEFKANLSRSHDRETPVSVAAHHWLEHVYLPAVASLASLVDERTSLAELYCQLLEHKWYLSERACHDVGHQAALEDFIRLFESD